MLRKQAKYLEEAGGAESAILVANYYALSIRTENFVYIIVLMLSAKTKASFGLIRSPTFDGQCFTLAQAPNIVMKSIASVL